MTAGADHYLEDCVSTPIAELFEPAEFVRRHIGLSPDDMTHMLGVVGAATAEELARSDGARFDPEHRAA